MKPAPPVIRKRMSLPTEIDLSRSFYRRLGFSPTDEGDAGTGIRLGLVDVAGETPEPEPVVEEPRRRHPASGQPPRHEMGQAPVVAPMERPRRLRRHVPAPAHDLEAGRLEARAP